jgi:hypothetical protein
MNRLVIPVLFLFLGTSGFCQAPTPCVDYLIASAAADFHGQSPSKSLRFRDVRVGHIISSDGTKQYMLCGQFTATQKAGKTKWEHFVTIKTNGYEQYVGRQADSFCQHSLVRWDTQKGLSSSLQNRLDSQR